MRAPPHLYSSMVDINEASNGMRASSSMSEKIDQVSPEAMLLCWMLLLLLLLLFSFGAVVHSCCW